MRSASLVVVFAIALTATGATPERVVREFYREITKRHPLGIPEGRDAKALRPFLTPRLLGIFSTAAACEKDYFRKNTCADCKPEFDWLELGLFSGGTEEALPSAIQILRSEPVPPHAFRVMIRFTYRDVDSTKYHWLGAVVVDCATKRCLIDDFMRLDDKTGEPLWTTSTSFRGCDGKRWVGVQP
ncbi:MAG TPA: hypothetical protein VJZ00_02580 [Thermoanaerobaculia bacterium]|nr:hypothetical protein [Thermoanaerobaculia bacterium]